MHEVSFARRFSTSYTFARRVLGVWVLPFSAYFNCCYFFLNIPNRIPPSGGQLMFISRRGTSFASLILNFSSFMIEVVSCCSYISPCFVVGVGCLLPYS